MTFPGCWAECACDYWEAGRAFLCWQCRSRGPCWERATEDIEVGMRGEVSSGNGHQEGHGTMLLHEWAVFSKGHRNTIMSDRCCNSLRVGTCLGRDGSRDTRRNVPERIAMDGSTHGPRASAPHHRRVMAGFFFNKLFFFRAKCR